MITDLTREERAELLAIADADDLIALGQRCLGHAGRDLQVLGSPETGLVMLQVREPVERVRFYIGELLVSKAEVVLDGTHGWAMRMGDDRVATLAAAICDAEVVAGGPYHDDVLALCLHTRPAAGFADADEWADLAPTVVDFEEMD